MLSNKIAFSTAYHPQTDGSAKRIVQTMEDILRRFCAYVLEYKDHEGYTHDWVTHLPAVRLAYNTSQHSTTGKKPSLVEKGWKTLFPVDHLKKDLLTIHPTAKDFHDMWKKACETASKFIAEAKQYNKQRWDKTHMEPDLKERDQVLKEEDKFPSTQKSPTPPEIVEVEDSPGPVRKIIKARNIRLNGKDQRQYLVRFKNQKGDKDKWLEEDAIPDGNLHLRRFRASRRTEQSHEGWAFFRGRVWNSACSFSRDIQEAVPKQFSKVQSSTNPPLQPNSFSAVLIHQDLYFPLIHHGKIIQPSLSPNLARYTLHQAVNTVSRIQYQPGVSLKDSSSQRFTYNSLL
ncbi:hypothetical protein O181_025848 [Austropuccinia psidii MF-1]|uniref:Integrase catalytic domain-containing protein n=1 Tax=Austropuccinia psidii MF-1 TaxID=1389203 RepID=A0A9Q3CNP1_9BASI|nr:hypothetical protein [Austropuccinia psidii MF-1]